MNSNVDRFLKEVNEVYNPKLTKIRLGNHMDGGYAVFHELCQTTTDIYSCGVGEDINFELDFVDKYPNTERWFRLFDPTIDCLPETHDQFMFQRTKGDFSGEIPQNSMLKMDIEYDEWEELLDMDDKILERFSQIVVEIHAIDIVNKQGLTSYFTEFHKSIYDSFNKVIFGLYARVLGGLNQMFYLCHVHPNNSLPMVTVNDKTFPPLMELTFVRKDLVPDAYKISLLNPTKGVDYPNKTDRPDIDYYPIGERC